MVTSDDTPVRITRADLREDPRHWVEVSMSRRVEVYADDRLVMALGMEPEPEPAPTGRLVELSPHWWDRMTPERRTAVLLAPGELKEARAALNAIRAEVEAQRKAANAMLFCHPGCMPHPEHATSHHPDCARRAVVATLEHLRAILDGVDGAATGGESP